MRLLSACLVLCFSLPALAQPDAIFGTGEEPVFREQDMDRRMSRSGVGRALERGTNDPNCAQVLAGLLTVLAEVAPRIHKRDEHFYVDQALWEALGTQMGVNGFPAQDYLLAMVRRVRIEGRLPQRWLDVGAQLARYVPALDYGKLRFMADGHKPIDSFGFTLPHLRHRYEVERGRATTAAAATLDLAFRDAYIDRNVAFGDLTLLDIGPEKKKRKGKKGKKTVDADEALTLMATLEWRPPAPEEHEINPFKSQKEPLVVRVNARLGPKQYVDLQRVPRGKRMLVRGRLWAIGKGVNSVELRDALLFEDRDWTLGAALASPAAVAQCPFAINELTGIAPIQPGGFKH